MDAVIEKPLDQSLIEELICQNTESRLRIPFGADFSPELVEEIEQHRKGE